MMKYWLNVSYMVELICACLLFLKPVRKRKHFVLIATVLSISMLILVGFYNEFVGKPDSVAGEIFYWAVYLIISILFVWICMGQSIVQSVYCSTCAFAVQHISYSLMQIYNLAGCESKVVSVGCYVLVYVMAYFFCAKKIPDNGRFVADKKLVFPLTTIIVIIWLLGILEGAKVAGFEVGRWYRMILCGMDCLCCVYALIVQINQKNLIQLHRELNGINTALYLQTGNIK